MSVQEDSARSRAIQLETELEKLNDRHTLYLEACNLNDAQREKLIVSFREAFIHAGMLAHAQTVAALHSPVPPPTHRDYLERILDTWDQSRT
jgi:hypothetical protein